MQCKNVWHALSEQWTERRVQDDDDDGDGGLVSAELGGEGAEGTLDG